MRILLFVFGWIFLQTISASAQDKNRYNFAQTYIGFSTQFITGNGTTTYQPDDIATAEKVPLPTVLQNRIEIGGLHFWRRADFYVSIPVLSINFNQPDALKAYLGTGVATGARYHFTPLHPKRFSPFAGFNWSVLSYSQKKENQSFGPELNKHRLMLEAGLSYTAKAFSITSIYAQYTPNHNFTYATSRKTFGEVNFPAFAFAFSYKKAFDFSANLSNPEVKKYNNTLTNHLNKNNRISGLTIGIGPSSAFSLQKNDYNKINRLFLANPSPVVLLPDIGLGYYFHKADAEIRLSYRPIKQVQQAYDFEQTAIRNSVVAEAFKFIGDYHGFVPFIGCFGGMEFLSLKEKDELNNSTVNFNDTKASYGIVTGWDIRLNHAQPFLLRTNIRYSPNLSLEANNSSFDFSQLEINFIQFVLYPQRIKSIRQFNKLLK